MESVWDFEQKLVNCKGPTVLFAVGPAACN